MLTKTTCYLAILFSLWIPVHAQKFMHSAGATIAIMHTRLNYEGNSQNLDFVLTDLTYFPRINLMESSNSSFSIGAPLSVGVGLASDYFSESKGIYWGFDIPLVADYNIGCKSTPTNENRFGGYLGAGFGYTYTNWSYDGPTPTHANSYGPLLRGGFRFGFPSSEKSQGLTIGLFYKIGLEPENYKTLGINLLVDF